MKQATVDVPIATIEKLASLGEAMVSLAAEMKKNTLTKKAKLSFPIPKLKRPKVIPKDQAWFWTEEWQKGEQEVNEALEKGDYKSFDSVEQLIADLHKQL